MHDAPVGNCMVGGLSSLGQNAEANVSDDIAKKHTIAVGIFLLAEHLAPGVAVMAG